MSYKAINGKIKTIANRGASFDKLVQEVAEEVIVHVEEHGEVSLACKLFLALPAGSRRLSLAHWFIKFGKISINTTKGQSKTIPFTFNKEGTTDLEGGKKVAWFDAKKAKTLAQEFKLDDKIERLLKDIAKAVELGQLSANDPKVVALKAVAGLAS
ncbi:hypothetical protein SCYZ1_2 [Pseudomonas phage SCYZ1]|nr:hypothetical protein SCYZ1_2 [Pseudomonas phage SCYZ1]